MNKEKLEKEADDYADEHAFRVPYDGSNKFYDDVDFKASKEGYLAGAKPREKRIKELCDNYDQFKAVVEPEIERLKKENAELQHKVDTLQGYLDHDIEYDMDKTIQEQKIKITELEKENARLTTNEKSLLIERKILVKENAELKCFIRDLIYENHNLCFHFSNTTCLFNSDYRNRAEELTGEKL